MNLPRRAITTTLTLLTLLLLLATPSAWAAKQLAVQDLDFLTPVDSIPDGFVQVETAQGEVLHGVVRRAVWTSHGISRFTLVEADGKRTRFDANQIRRLSVPAELWAQEAVVARAVTTIENDSNTDDDPIATAKELIFDSVAWPDNDHRVLLQRVNLGFDQSFRVNALANGNQETWTLGSVPAFSNEKSVYLVTRANTAPIQVEKKIYRKQFATLFGDCPQMLTRYKKNDRDFSDFANHIANYDQLCTLKPTTNQPGG